MNKSKRKGVMKTLVLSIIIRFDKIHGYMIYKNLLSMGMEKWSPSIGTLYRLLKELEKDGLVMKEADMEGSRRIVYYYPTEKGVEEYLKTVDVFLDKMIIGMELMLPTLKKLGETGLNKPILDDKLRYIDKLLSEYLEK